ncbi:MAG: linear amide C-N hydrolase [Candidatus Odinarchaeota archaeon]
MEAKNINNISKRIKKKKIITLIALLAIITPIVIIISFSERPASQQDTLSSLKKIDNHPLYTMNYLGDYGFEDYLKTGEFGYNQTVLSTDWACTCFATLNNQTDMLFGRNFDWSHRPALILYTDPPNGYKSISMVDLGFLGFYNDYQISQQPIENLQELLLSPYFLLDGMNEYGLTIGCMAIPNAENVIDPEKVTLGSLSFMRLVLDYAININEAIDLWDNYNVYFPPGPDLHYLIADAKGNSAVIEWVGGEMIVLRNEQMWQVSTNFVIYGSTNSTKQGCSRYTTCESVLSDNEGNITPFEAMNLLETVSQSSTQWSVVYNMQKKEVKLVMGRNYNYPIHEFSF